MTLETSFTELQEGLKRLERTLDNLLWAVVQGQPEAGQGHALVDHYDAATNDLIGWVQEAKEAAEKGRKATKGQLDLAQARQALTICQDRFNRVSVRFYGDLVSFEWIDALNNLARERGDAWAKWVQGVKDALNRCPESLDDVCQGLFGCWRALTEWAGLPSVSAQATGTGPQIYITGEKVGNRRATT